MTDVERKLLEKAITALIAALAFDEALQCNASAETLEELRGFWVPDAEQYHGRGGTPWIPGRWARKH